MPKDSQNICDELKSTMVCCEPGIKLSIGINSTQPTFASLTPIPSGHTDLTTLLHQQGMRD